jgi:hypothetical protein
VFRELQQTIPMRRLTEDRWPVVVDVRVQFDGAGHDEIWLLSREEGPMLWEAGPSRLSAVMKWGGTEQRKDEFALPPIEQQQLDGLLDACKHPKALEAKMAQTEAMFLRVLFAHGRYSPAAIRAALRFYDIGGGWSLIG